MLRSTISSSAQTSLPKRIGFQAVPLKRTREGWVGSPPCGCPVTGVRLCAYGKKTNILISLARVVRCTQLHTRTPREPRAHTDAVHTGDTGTQRYTTIRTSYNGWQPGGRYGKHWPRIGYTLATTTCYSASCTTPGGFIRRPDTDGCQRVQRENTGKANVNKLHTGYAMKQ